MRGFVELTGGVVAGTREAIRDGIDGVWLARRARWGLATLDPRHGSRFALRSWQAGEYLDERDEH